MKITVGTSLLAFALLYSLPTYGVSEQREIAPVTVDPATTRLVHPLAVLQQRIARGRASMADIKQALNLGQPGDVANSLAGLYSMRKDVRVRRLLYDLWRDERRNHADLPWDKLQHPVIRVAIAAVMNRIAAGTVVEFLDYLRSQADSDIELVRAQVALALGMTGYLEDLPLLEEYAVGDSDYVANSAILGLGYVYQIEAKQLLIGLLEKYKGDKRGVYIAGILRAAYQWQPE